MEGRNKATLRVGDRRIVDRQLALLRTIADPVFIVSNRRDDFAELDVEVEPDALPYTGALSGIYTAIIRSPRVRTLIVACDMPFLDAPFLRRLVQPSQAELVIPRSPRGYEPLCAVWSSAAAPAVRRRLERGELKAARMVEDLRVEEIGPDVLASYDPQGRLFLNVNTPHEYDEAQALNRLATDGDTRREQGKIV
jgi:molybdopterin-guanine dinucleotide biosynthesis protein A